MKITNKPVLLTIAGSDSSAGAGIQADLKTIAALGGYGVCAITCFTAQNPQTTLNVGTVAPELVQQQLTALAADFDIKVIKIGAITAVNQVNIIADFLRKHSRIPVILDPVMICTNGHQLVGDEVIKQVVKLLFPLATLITPNVSEAAHLLRFPEIQASEFPKHAKKLQTLGSKAVLIKGGDDRTNTSFARDYLLTDTADFWLESPRVETLNTHGTGCTLSSAIATIHAHGHNLSYSVQLAKRFLTKLLEFPHKFQNGPIGPLDHLAFNPLNFDLTNE